VCKESIECKFI